MLRTIIVWSSVAVLIVLNLTLFSELPEVFVWGSVIAWDITAALFFADALRVHLRSRRELKRLNESAGGAWLVACGRFVISDWFLNGAALGLLAGLISTYRLTLAELDSSLALQAGSAARVIIIIMFFCFWRSKRANLLLSERAIEYYRSLLTKETPLE